MFDPDNPNAHLFVREPWRPWPAHPFDRRYRDIELLVIPDNNDRIHRVERRINPDGVAYQRIIEVQQDIITQRIGDTTWVSVRFIAYALGMDVIWNRADQSTTIDPDGVNLRMRKGDRFIWAGNRLVPVRGNGGRPATVFVENGRVMVPLETLAVALNMPTRRNENTQTSYLYILSRADFTRFTYPEFEIEILRASAGVYDLGHFIRRVENDVVYHEYYHDTPSDALAFTCADTGTVMVPIRWVAQALDLELYRLDSHTTIIDPHNRNIRITRNDTTLYVNDTPHAILDNHNNPTPAILINGRVFLPLRTLSEVFHMPFGQNHLENAAYLYLVR